MVKKKKLKNAFFWYWEKHSTLLLAELHHGTIAKQDFLLHSYRHLGPINQAFLHPGVFLTLW